MRLFYKFIILLCSCFIIDSALAQPSAASPPIPQENNISGGYTSKFWASPPKGSQTPTLYLFTPSPSFTPNAAASQLYNYFFQQQPDSDTNELIANIIAYNQKQNSQLLASSLLIPLPIDNTNNLYSINLKENDLSVESVSPGAHTNITSAVDTGPKSPAIYSSVAPLSLNSLISTVQYNVTTNKNGSTTVDPAPLNFIKYVSGQYTPPQLIDFSALSDDDKKSVLLTTPVQKYLATLRQYAASISVGLNNLEYLYHERIPQKTSAALKNANPDIIGALPTSLQSQASELAIDQWMATRRLTSSGANDKDSWLSKIEKASPATLQRENALLSAENRYELFKIRQDLERLIALMSVRQLQSAQQSEMNLQASGREACQNKTLQSSGACPAALNTPSSG